MINIGSVINDLLTADTSINNIVGDQIYPEIKFDESIPNPVLVYDVLEIKPDYTRDGLESDNVTFSVYGFTDTYSEGIDLIQYVRNAIEWKKGNYYGYNLSNIRMVDGQSMNIKKGGYAQELIFTTTTRKN